MKLRSKARSWEVVELCGALQSMERGGRRKKERERGRGYTRTQTPAASSTSPLFARINKRWIRCAEIKIREERAANFNEIDTPSGFATTSVLFHYRWSRVVISNFAGSVGKPSGNAVTVDLRSDIAPEADRENELWSGYFARLIILNLSVVSIHLITIESGEDSVQHSLPADVRSVKESRALRIPPSRLSLGKYVRDLIT